MSSSLGLRNSAEHAPQTARKPASTAQVAIEMPKASRSRLPSGCTVCGRKSACPLPGGFLMTLFYLAGAVTIPLVYFYEPPDYTTDEAKAGVIALAGVVATFLFMSGSSMCIFYNIVLGFYTGIEVKVIDLALTWSQEDDRSDEAMYLSAIGAGVVILHLLPFYLSNSGFLVTFFAAAGLVVNAALLVYIDTSLLLFVFTAGISFFVSAMCMISFHGGEVSLLSSLRHAIKHGDWFTCKAPSLTF